MWTEGASAPKAISMQVADVHKALLSLSRCADMGFESRFGAAYGCLLDTTNGEVIPLFLCHDQNPVQFANADPRAVRPRVGVRPDLTGAQ